MIKNNFLQQLCIICTLFTSTFCISQTDSWINSNYYRYTAFNGSQLDFSFSNTSFARLTTNRSYFQFGKELRVVGGRIGAEYSSHLQLRTNGVERMRILSSNGFVGINNTSPTHHLQIFGNTDYIVSNSATYMNIPNEDEVSDVQPKTSLNYGHTSRISLTNTNTGNGVNDGGIIFQAQNDLYIQNKASGKLSLGGGGVGLHFSNGRAYLGEGVSSLSSFAYLNIRRHTDNGLRVRVTGTGNYGILSIAGENENAFIVSDQTYPTSSDLNFKVTGGGEVYARKYITTLNPFPDYVFSEDYELMNYQDLRNYIYTNKHLPNIPKATTVEENGMDLGELNRILVEKVEELTLYILELEDRLSEIEKEESSTNAEENTLVERISKLEALIEKLNK